MSVAFPWEGCVVVAAEVWRSAPPTSLGWAIWQPLKHFTFAKSDTCCAWLGACDAATLLQALMIICPTQPSTTNGSAGRCQ